MSAIYDNWERIVAAVLKKEQLWQLFHEQSRSPSLSSESSSGFSFSFCQIENDGPFSISSPKWAVSDQEEYEIGRESNILVKDQSPVVNLGPSKDITLAQRRKRALKIQVPKPDILDYACFNLNPERLECQPRISPGILSPRLTSPVSSSRVHSRTGSPQTTKWPDDAKQKSYPLPLPPGAVSNSPPSSCSNSSATSPSTPLRSPGRAEDLKSPGTRWKKGRLLGRGPFGDVYIGFDSEKGEMCAMKEIKVFSGDAISSARVWEKEISLLSTLKHPNIVQYYGSEMVDDKLYVYSEYVSGGSIHTILQQYGKLGESAIRNYTRQILSGLAYLHSRYIAHRDLKGATILVDPKGRVKLASFGLGKQIAGQYMSSLLMDSAYWMAPEVIMNPNERKLSSDIWSLGCTVLEMAISKPPISQYKEVVAMFKIGNHKELPTIPDYLSDEGKDFVRLCLQWDPKHRATASQLLEHPFVKSSSPYPQMLVSASSVHPAAPNAIKSEGNDHARNLHQFDSRTLATHSSRASKSNFQPGNKSAPVSPVGSPLPHPSSQHLNRQMSPPPRLSLHKAATSLPTPLTGGISAIPYPHLNQLISPQETLRNLPKHSTNSPPYWDPNILRGVHSDHKLVSSDNNNIQKQFANGRLYEQLALADRFFQQLHTAPVKSNTSTDRDPYSLLTRHRIG